MPTYHLCTDKCVMAEADNIPVCTIFSEILDIERL